MGLKNLRFLLLLLAVSVHAQVPGSPRPAHLGDKPLPCDPISLMRRPPDFTPPTRIPVMEDRYLSLQMTMAGQERTHIPLVADDGGKLIPAGCGDSPGIFYVVPKLSTLFHLSLPDTLDVFLIGTVVAAVLVGIVGLFVLFRGGAMSYAAIPVLLLLGGFALHYGDLYPLAPSVAMAVIPWALVATQRSNSRNLLCALAFFMGIAVGFANFIRDQAGTGVLLFAGILFAFAAHASRRTRTTAIVAMLIGALFPGVTGHFLLNRRDAYLAKVQPGYVPGVRSHVLWHSVYIGFGFLQNDVVPEYKDEVAVDKVRSMSPDVIYLSAKYDNYVRRAVVDFVRHHPLLIATTVFAKFGVLLMYFLLAANLGIFAAMFRPKPLWIEVAWLVVLAFEALPGLVAVPRPTYLAGYVATAGLYGLVSIENLLRSNKSVSASNDGSEEPILSTPLDRDDKCKGEKEVYVV